MTKAFTVGLAALDAAGPGGGGWFRRLIRSPFPPPEKHRLVISVSKIHQDKE